MTVEEKKLIRTLKRFYSGVKSYNFQDAEYTKYTGRHEFEYCTKIDDFEEWMKRKIEEPGIQGLDIFDDSHSHHQIQFIDDYTNDKFSWTYELVKNDKGEIAECLVKVSLKVDGRQRVVTSILYINSTKYSQEERLLLMMYSRANEYRFVDLYKRIAIKDFLETQVEKECTTFSDEDPELEKLSREELIEHIKNNYDDFLGAGCDFLVRYLELPYPDFWYSYTNHKKGVLDSTAKNIEKELNDFENSEINPVNVYLANIDNSDFWGGFEGYEQFMPKGNVYASTPFFAFGRYEFINSKTFEFSWEKKTNGTKGSYLIRYKYTLPFESKFYNVRLISRTQCIEFELLPIDYYSAHDYNLMIQKRQSTLIVKQDIHTKRKSTEEHWFVRKIANEKEQVMSASDFLEYSKGTIDEHQSVNSFFDLVNVINIGLKIFKVKLLWKPEEGVDILISAKLVHEWEGKCTTLLEYEFNHIFYNKKTIKHFTSKDENGNIITHSGGEVNYE